MKNRGKYYTTAIILVLMGSILTLNARMLRWHIEPAIHYFTEESIQDELTNVQDDDKQSADTTPPRFPVSPIIPEKADDLNSTHPIDLRTPTNFKNDFEYNPLTNRYELRSKIGGSDIKTPISLTQEEYLRYSLERSMGSYYRQRNREDAQTDGGEAGNEALGDYAFQFDLGPAEKLFGPGGVKLEMRGSTEIKMGIINNVSENPTLSERERNKTTFDFDAKIQASVDASVGDKINFTLNYDTESTFDFDSKKLKLAYTGKEDEIIKTLEAGDVSMTTSNSLIRGGTSLFGIKGIFQFGKLTMGVLFSQQESQSRTTKSKGNIQTTPFEITVDSYDENMHYFLAQYFRDTYDRSLATNPYIRSGISIEEIEVWVTNKRSSYDESRNIVAFSDLAEHDSIFNTDLVQPYGNSPLPFNRANTLYNNLITNFPQARNKDEVTRVLGDVMTTGQDFEKIENARKLTSSDYILNRQLGYISLKTRLQADEVLAVAYTYTYRGEAHEVGELSTKSAGNTSDNLYLKMLKGTSVSPSHPTWDLMMKNVYTIISSGRAIEKDKFRLDVKFQNDTTGVYLTYLSEGAIANTPLLSVMNLDRLDSNNNSYPDGFFDYVEGNTVLSSQGKIIFPVVEPFGRHLRKKIANDSIADKYVYQELYDSTLTIARQNAEKNKFILTGEYKGAGSSSISLEGYNISQGSVAVYANGTLLKENTDYTINYNTGEVTIINAAYVNADITTQSENRSSFGMQRKTMMGVDLNYAFTPNFNVGATIMNLSEMPLTLKNQPGEESVNNTIWGLNTNFTTQSYWLTNLLDKLPLVDLTAPSQISLNAEYAQLIPGHYKSEYGGDYSYIDDFESAKRSIDIRSPYYWFLSSTPSMFSESKETNKLIYGNNRALLAWYQIDPLFTRKSPLTPTHIKNDLEQLSNHYVREVNEDELFPGKDASFNESTTVSVLNLAYYPKERGPYNLDAENMNPDGTLMNPEGRWGGIYRKIEGSQSNFEEQNVEHIEFWLMDPFIYDRSSKGGDLYFNLGEVSEDILKDGKKFFENGIPVNGDTSKITVTAWGLVPNTQSLTYAFDVDGHKAQDVGLNGLSTDQEFEFEAYKNYIEKLKNEKLNSDAIARMELDPFSPLNDPAGDNYHYYRGSDYDRRELSILERYKRYNGTEGNSSNNTGESYSTAAQIQPDVEDINQDNTLNENESYFQYKISLNPDDLNIGKHPYIVDKRETAPSLKNGNRETINWYLFKIPIKEYEKKVGNISDFSSIRFVRMFLTNFSDSTVLRFGTLELVRGDWRAYTKDLSNPNMTPTTDAAISISTVNIEENGRKEPVNYIMPPGVNRMIDPQQPQLRTQNEQSLALKITELSSGDARAIYKTTNMDTRQYRRLQMFVHAESLPEDLKNLQDDELSIFLRLGSDYINNYYEYEIPLKLTPHGQYTTESSVVWPDANMFDFPFDLLTDTKLQRNKDKRYDSEVNYYTPYTVRDPNRTMNSVTVRGNPTLSEVKVIMIGVRNNSGAVKDAEVWINEMRLTDYNEDGGWAANVNLFVGLSDLGSISFSGKTESAGFGSIDQGIMDRNIDDYLFMNFSAQLEMGKFFPEKAKVNLPVYFSYSKEQYDPKYNPLDQDILLDDALDAAESKQERDSILSFARDVVTNKSLEINNVRVNVTSKKPMPYDPSNFTLGYSYNIRKLQNSTTEYETETDTRLLFGYSYSPMMNPWQPFAKGNKNQSGNRNQSRSQSRSSSSSGGANFFQDIGIGLLPKTIAFNSDINRNYFEMQIRDINSSGSIPVSFREDFYWNRDFNLQWDLTKNLNLNLKTGTEAMIETPHEQVNKKLNKDGYEIWKDSVARSIQNFGTPMNYDQAFTAKYTVPFRNIPILNFITAGLSYTATYSWDRGATVSYYEDEDEDQEEGEEVNLGNTIQSTRTWGIDNVNFNLNNLYSKSKFLDEANKKFSMNNNPSSSRQNNNSRNNRNNPRNENQAKKKYEGEVTLNTDSSTLVNHALNNKRIRVTAKDENGKIYEVKYKKKDANSIEIKTKDSVMLNLTITQLPPLEDEWWYKPAQVAARGLMMVRTIGFSYSETSDMTIPGFNQDIGDFFGQRNSSFGYTPGLDFAFGFVDKSYIDKADRNGWLNKTEDNIDPAIMSKRETFSFTSLVEPFVGLKINLTASRSSTSRSQYYYMYNDMSPRFSGDLTMTTIGLKGIFGGGNSDDGYYSKVFEEFRRNREIIAGRIEDSYAGVNYPSSMGGGVYDPTAHPVDRNSSDVLIPAFYAAYTGKSASSSSLDLFPSLAKLLPNWSITYDGLMQIPLFKKYFKSFALEHTYKGTYTIGSYNSHTDWQSADGDRGFVRSVDESPIPSSAYNITSVSIKDDFNPLFKVSSTLLNNMSFNVNYRLTRTSNLNISSYQVVEVNERGWTFGTGYRFENFNRVLKLPKSGGANFNNELRTTIDVTYAKSDNLIRKIEDGLTQATQGSTRTLIKFTADYSMSKMVTFQAYFDREVSRPLVSSTAYPFTKTSFGINLKINFAR